MLGYFCRDCNQQVSITKQQRFTRLSPNLIFQFKRFGYNPFQNERYKIQNIITFPLEIDMTAFSSSNPHHHDHHGQNQQEFSNQGKEDEMIYSLRGVIVHIGEALSGHYVYYMIGCDGKWYEVNDERVTCKNEEELISEWFGGEVVGYF